MKNEVFSFTTPSRFVIINVSKDSTTIFRFQVVHEQQTTYCAIYPNERGSKLLSSVGIYLPIDKGVIST
jgi:hypothetical protein